MKITIKKRSALDIIAYLALFLYLVISLFSVSFFEIMIPSFISKSILYVIVGLLLGRELTKRDYRLADLILLVLFLILAVGSFTNGQGFLTHYTVGLLMIFCLRDLDFSELAPFILRVTIGMLLVIIISSQLGIIRDYVEVSGTRTRHYLGFRYSLFPASVMFNITALTIYLKNYQIKYSQILLLLAGVLYIFLMTNSRLTFLNSCILLFIVLLMKIFPNILLKSRLLLLPFSLTYLVAAITSYFMATSYTVSNSSLVALNRFLGGRLYLAGKSLSIYGFNLFGQNINWVGNGLNIFGQKSRATYLYVDNMYIQQLQRYGLIFLIVLVLLYTLTLVKLYQTRQLVLFVIMVAIGFHGAIDDLMSYLYYNSFLLLIPIFFMQSKKEERLDSVNLSSS